METEIFKMKSPCCNVDLVFRKKSKRKGELLLTCPSCQSKWQCRDGKYSHPYQTKKSGQWEIKSVMVRGRITPTRQREILEKYESIQEYLDNGLLE